jgi:TonB family protein
MAPPFRSPRAVSSRPRLPSLGYSFFIHGAVLGWVAFGPAPEKPKTLYEQLIAPNEHKLVWYRFSKKLPEVSPAEKKPAPGAGRAGVDLKEQTIVARSAQPTPAPQMVWQPAPQLKLKQELKSPNLLAFQAPQPPPARPRLFTPPPAAPRPAPPVPTLPEAPAITPGMDIRQHPHLRNTLPDALAAKPKPKPKPFAAPAAPQRAPAPVPLLPAAPRIAPSATPARSPELGDPLGAAAALKPRPKAFVPPPLGQGPAASPAFLPGAPQIAAAAAGNGSPAIGDIVGAALAAKPAPKQFTVPRPATAPKAAPLLEAPELAASALPSNLNAAVVGLQPSDRLNVPVPPGSRPAQFSAGPEKTGSPGGAEPVQGARLSVPGLMVRDNDKRPGEQPLRPTLLARASPTSRQSLLAAARTALAAPPALADAPAPAMVSSAPDPRFEGRRVYTMAVQMPNVTSAFGSWIMWFAERQPDPGQTAAIQLPVPLRKVDPKYVPSAVADRVEGKVQLSGVLRADGRVDLLTLLKSLDERLDRSAADALLKWEFEPARRNGVPVEVDLVVEIPFRLAPPAER